MDTGIIIGIVGIASNIIGVFISYLFFKKSKKERKPLYSIESNNYVHSFLSQIEGLSINYKKRPIKTLTGSRISIWNAGKETIKRSDIASGEKIRIELEKGLEFLNIEEFKVTNEANKCNVELVDNTILIDFEYLDYQEGLALEVFHTGKTSWSLKVLGSIIGGGKIKHAKSLPYPKRKRKAQLISVSIFLVSFAISIYMFGFGSIKNILIINAVISGLFYSFIPMIITYTYHVSVRPSLDLGVRDDDELLVSPPFGDKKTLNERDPNSEPYV